MDQPTAEEALGRLEVLVGEWTLEAKPPEGQPWPGQVGGFTTHVLECFDDRCPIHPTS